MTISMLSLVCCYISRPPENVCLPTTYLSLFTRPLVFPGRSVIVLSRTITTQIRLMMGSMYTIKEHVKEVQEKAFLMLLN